MYPLQPECMRVSAEALLMMCSCIFPIPSKGLCVDRVSFIDQTAHFNTEKQRTCTRGHARMRARARTTPTLHSWVHTADSWSISRVNASVEHLPSIKVEISTQANPGNTLHTVSLMASNYFEFPSMPRDKVIGLFLLFTD